MLFCIQRVDSSGVRRDDVRIYSDFQVNVTTPIITGYRGTGTEDVLLYKPSDGVE